MKKYIAKIVYQIVSGNGMHKPQFDEQLHLIEGRDEKEALKKARFKGRSEEESFPNDREEIVQWKFIDVVDLVEIKDMKDGSQIYSRIEETEDATNYINIARQKARTIETLSNLAYVF
ncbi:MAG TPA: DUF4288 domain-containing protein [Bacteroidia bacterium]|jgi:hypothetical protein|nr:DUF4288 domain-containing protein [Bacteroidia bacterium]